MAWNLALSGGPAPLGSLRRKAVASPGLGKEERQELLSDGTPWWHQMLIAVSSGSPRIKEASCSGGGGGTGLARGWDHTDSSQPLVCASPLPTWSTLFPWSDAFREASHSRSPLPLPSPITPRTTPVVNSLV